MVYEIFTRKRSPESSSSEPPRKFQSWESRASNAASRGSWSRRSNYPPANEYRAERNFGRNDFERRPPATAEARINPFSRSPPRKPEENLEPPGTGSSTLQYTLTPRVAFMTWKDRLYRELEELNCLFTIEPTLRKKANMALEDELTYRNLAKAIICMRLDDAHMALVANVDDPLKVMKVLADFREPEYRHLEKRAQQRLSSTVYHAAVPVRDFLRTFENLLKEVEKNSGERMDDNKMKQHLLSAIVGDFPNIMDDSKVPSNEICYDELKKLLIEAVEQRTAGKNAQVEQRRAASNSVSTTERHGAATSVASQNATVSEKQPVDKKIEATGQRAGKVDEQRIDGANAQGLKSRIGASQIVEVKDRCPVGLNAGSRNADAKEHHPGVSNPICNNATAKEVHPKAEDKLPAVKNTAGNQVVGKLADENKQYSVDTTITNQSSAEHERHPISGSPAAVERPHAIKDSKGIERGPGAKSVKDEQPPCAKDTTANERGSTAKSVVDERPVSIRNTNTNERRIVAKSIVGEQPISARDTTANERRSATKSVMDERPVSTRDTNTNQRHVAAKPIADEQPVFARGAAANERRFVAKSVIDERPLPTRGARPNERRSGTYTASRNVDADDLRPAGTSTQADKQSTAAKNTEENHRRLASSNAASKNENGDERYAAAKSGGSNQRFVVDANAIGGNSALYERRAPKPSAPTPKDELEEQLELDRRIQQQIEINSRLASKEISCTKCGAYGHTVGDCKRKDNRRKCYSCLEFVDDHVASTCPYWEECAAMPPYGLSSRTSSKCLPESRASKPTPSMKPPPSPPSFGESLFFADNRSFPEDDYDEDDDEDEDDLPLVGGLRQVLHIRRKLTTKKLKTGRVARKDLIFTDSDFYMDVEYREMFIEEDEEEPGDIILETIKVMSTNQT